MNWRQAPRADFAVIGDPVSHSLSPRMHQAAYDALGLGFKYVALHVPAGEVGDALDHLAELGYQGVNVTVPHKLDAIAWCSIRETFSERVQAANTLRLSDRACINTDAPGFLDTLRDRSVGPCRTLLLGAGGSARALAAALADAGYELVIQNRTRSRAEAMVADLGINATILDTPDPTGCRLVVNTTSSSLQGESVALDWSAVSPEALVYDLMYTKHGTSFLSAAESHGLKTVDGLPLLVAQGARSFEWWLGREAPRQAMMEALRCAS